MCIIFSLEGSLFPLQETGVSSKRVNKATILVRKPRLTQFEKSSKEINEATNFIFGIVTVDSIRREVLFYYEA